MVATFVAITTVDVTITGAGAVSSSDGRRCTAGTCTWPTTEPILLTAEPATGAVFAGFSGACSGLVACTLSSGSVTATFSDSTELLNIEFDGSGQGVVRDASGQFVCDQSCSLRVPHGLQLELLPTALEGSVFQGFAGDCMGDVCTVTAPATVRVRFDAGRLVEVVTPGTGGGDVWLDGQLCPIPCRRVVPVDVGLTVAALADETSRFDGFSGDCTGDNCSVGAGNAPVTVIANFSSVLEWVRSFPIPSGDAVALALAADDAGIGVAVTAARSLVVDGVTFQEPFLNRNYSPYMLDMALDGGVRWVLPLYDTVDAGAGYTGITATSLARSPEGGWLLAGGCSEGHFQGRACGALTSVAEVPLLVEVADAGISRFMLRDDLTGAFGAKFLEVDFLANTSVLRFYRFQAGAQWSEGFLSVDSTWDAGVVAEASDYQDRGNAEATSVEGSCLPDGEALLCAGAVTGGFTGLGCPVSTSGSGGDDLALFRFYPSGQCDLVDRRPSTSSLTVVGLSRAQDGGVMVGGDASGLLQLAPGLSTGPGSGIADQCLATFENGAWSQLWRSTRTSFAMLKDMVPRENRTLVLGRTGPDPSGWTGTWFGVPTTLTDSAYVLTFDTNGVVRRRWPILSSLSSREELRLGHMARVGDQLIVTLVGAGYTFRGQPLAPDMQMRLFVMSFRE